MTDFNKELQIGETFTTTQLNLIDLGLVELITNCSNCYAEGDIVRIIGSDEDERNCITNVDLKEKAIRLLDGDGSRDANWVRCPEETFKEMILTVSVDEAQKAIKEVLAFEKILEENDHKAMAQEFEKCNQGISQLEKELSKLRTRKEMIQDKVKEAFQI